MIEKSYLSVSRAGLPMEAFFLNVCLFGLLRRLFSSCGAWELLCGCSMWTSHCGGFSCYRAQASGARWLRSGGTWLSSCGAAGA